MSNKINKTCNNWDNQPKCLSHLQVDLREKSLAAVFRNQQPHLCRRMVTTRRAMVTSAGAWSLLGEPWSPLQGSQGCGNTESIQTTALGLTKEPCSKLWRQIGHRRWASRGLSKALQMRGQLWLTVKGLRNCRDQAGQPQARGVPHTTLEGGGGFEASSHPVLSST